MSRFYLLLAVVAVVAGVLIWRGAQGGSADVSATAAVAPVAVTPADSAFKGFVLGSATAPVEVTEYADFQCPHCGEFANVQFPTIKEQLINTGRLRWRFRDYPLDFPWSRVAALAGQCAGEQGKFWDYHRSLMTAKGPMDDTDLKSRAAALKLDPVAFSTCLASDRFDATIRAAFDDGTRVGVNSTPTYFVNGRMMTGALPFDEFREVVDSELDRSR